MERSSPYEVLGPLGAGGMSDVSLARNEAGRIVVLKKQRNPQDDTFLLDEARVGLRLKHPNIVQTLGTFYENGRPVLVLEYIPGVMVNSFLTTGALSPAEIGFLGGQIADALHALHSAKDERGQPQPIVHRDVTPGNVLVDLNGNARLIDLGIARWAQRHSPQTEVGFVKGTPRYLAPEVYTGTPPQGVAADVWALGATLWELNLGMHIALGPLPDFVERICQGKLISAVERAVVPSPLLKVLDRLTETSVEKRLSAEEATLELKALTDKPRAAQLALAQRVRRAGGKPLEKTSNNVTKDILRDASSTFGNRFSTESSLDEPCIAAHSKKEVHPASQRAVAIPHTIITEKKPANFSTQEHEKIKQHSATYQRKNVGFNQDLPPTAIEFPSTNVPFDMPPTVAQPSGPSPPSFSHADFSEDAFGELTDEKTLALMQGLAQRSMQVRAIDEKSTSAIISQKKLEKNSLSTAQSPSPLAANIPTPFSFEDDKTWVQSIEATQLDSISQTEPSTHLVTSAHAQKKETPDNALLHSKPQEAPFSFDEETPFASQSASPLAPSPFDDLYTLPAPEIPPTAPASQQKTAPSPQKRLLHEPRAPIEHEAVPAPILNLSTNRHALLHRPHSGRIEVDSEREAHGTQARHSYQIAIAIALMLMVLGGSIAIAYQTGASNAAAQSESKNKNLKAPEK